MTLSPVDPGAPINHVLVPSRVWGPAFGASTHVAWAVISPPNHSPANPGGPIIPVMRRFRSNLQAFGEFGASSGQIHRMVRFSSPPPHQSPSKLV